MIVWNLLVSMHNNVIQSKKTLKNLLTGDGDFCRIVTMSRNAVNNASFYWWRWPVGHGNG